MQPGRACITCHESQEDDPVVWLAAVYPTLREPDGCCRTRWRRCCGRHHRRGGRVTSCRSDQPATSRPSGGAFRPPLTMPIRCQGREGTEKNARWRPLRTTGNCNGCQYRNRRSAGAPDVSSRSQISALLDSEILVLRFALFRRRHSPAGCFGAASGVLPTHGMISATTMGVRTGGHAGPLGRGYQAQPLHGRAQSEVLLRTYLGRTNEEEDPAKLGGFGFGLVPLRSGSIQADARTLLLHVAPPAPRSDRRHA